MNKSKNEEIAYRCIVDTSEVDLSDPKRIKFTYTDYEDLQNEIIKALDAKDKEYKRVYGYPGSID